VNADPPISSRDKVLEGPPEELPPLPEDRDAAKRAAGREFPCASCGASLSFAPGAQKLECSHCGHVEAIAPQPGRDVAERDLRAILEKLAERRTAEKALVDGLFEVRCDGCGATVRFAGSLTTTACAYCAQPIHREGVHDAQERVPVDGVLPFRVEQGAARQNLKTWTRSRWFLPGELRRDGIQAAFQGVYLPFFTFDAFTSNHFSGQRGTRHTMVIGSGKSRTVIVYYTWRAVVGSFERFFDDVLESAGSGLPDQQMADLEPWPLKGLQPFSPQFLSGFLARTYDHGLDRCFASAQARIRGEIERDVRRRIGGDAQRVHSIDTAWPGLTFKHVLLPIWIATYRWKTKPYRVVVNAATGEVQGERPWSGWKIFFFVLTLAAIAGGVALVVAANS
jgi:LSD1 subclass zinc finger protein